jgi:hypothetical protein
MKVTKKQVQIKNNLLKIARYIFFMLLTLPLNAANYVTVATIGNRVPEVNKSDGMQGVVEQVKGFWHKKLGQVLPDKPDLIVLPEFCDFARGLTKKEKSEYLKVRQNQVVDFFASEAKANSCYIAFGMQRSMEDGTWRNSCIVVNREGKIAGIYDKYFPTPDDIDAGVKAGTETPLIHCDFGSIGCAICFDLNFEEVRRGYERLNPDILVFPSMYHGGLVQNHWAYSCRSFFVGSMTFREIPSEIRDPLGDVVATTTNYFDFAVTTINLDSRLVHLGGGNWPKLTRMKEKYGRKVKIKEPGKLGAVLVSCEDENLTVGEMLNEFDIELLDDFFDRARRFRPIPEGEK